MIGKFTYLDIVVIVTIWLIACFLLSGCSLRKSEVWIFVYETSQQQLFLNTYSTEKRCEDFRSKMQQKEKMHCFKSPIDDFN